jgi:hypothetical protein
LGLLRVDQEGGNRQCISVCTTQYFDIEFPLEILTRYILADKTVDSKVILKLIVQKWVVMAEWFELAYFEAKFGFCDKQRLLSVLKNK